MTLYKKQFMHRIFTCVIITVVMVSCRRNEDHPNKFSDAILVKLYDLQDRRSSDSLSLYTDVTNLSYKQTATLSFGSIQDTLYVNKLVEKLSDQDVVTRVNAAFALGQTGGKQTADFLIKRISKEQDSLVLYEIFQAIGKVINRSEINQVLNSDDRNLPWLCYRYALRENCDSTLVLKVSQFLSPDYPLQTRLGASHFFTRGKIDKAGFVGEALIRSATNDSSPEVRMAAAAGLKHVAPSSSIETIEKIISQEVDYRVRVNAVRSLATFPFDATKNVLFNALKDTSVNVSVASAEIIRQTLTKPHYKETLLLAKAIQNWRVQAILFESVMAFATSSEQQEITNDVRKIYSSSENNYQKAALLQVLAQSSSSFEFIRNELLSSGIPVLQSSSAIALAAMNGSSQFPASLKQRFLETYIAAIERGDAAVIGIVTDALMDSALGYKKIVKDISFLQKAKDKLSLPRDYESYVPLENAIAYFENREAKPVDKSFNHPIDWTLVKTIDAHQLAVIKTTKGDITIQLFVEEAPGSVGNFVSLVKRDYYDGKFFHRVVPNFVIQGGCPRGDGWGSEDYSIRSEFSGRKYKTGSVGMASAGKDTEGVQWFITHSPTPHLDGRYTIFAEVTKGMEVVHTIEVGDQILDIQLLNSTVQ